MMGYRHLDEMKARGVASKEANPKQTFEESLQTRVGAFGGEERLKWIYGNDIEKVWEVFFCEGESGCLIDL